MRKIREIIEEQFTYDYNCKPEDFRNTDTLVTEYKPHAKARLREEEGILTMLVYRGKLVITSAPELLKWCEEKVKPNVSAEWCFEAGTLISIDKRLAEYGYEIDKVHIYFTPHDYSENKVEGVTIIGKDKIAELEEDERIDEAFLFEDDIEDVLGAVCYDENDEILAVSGASANSDLMWEMGVNSFKEGKGYGKTTILALTNEILKLGKVPFYGTALSHLASQNVALSAGLVPTFAELTTRKIEE